MWLCEEYDPGEDNLTVTEGQWAREWPDKWDKKQNPSIDVFKAILMCLILERKFWMWKSTI